MALSTMAEHCYAGCPFMVNVVMLSVSLCWMSLMLGVPLWWMSLCWVSLYAECHYAKFRDALITIFKAFSSRCTSPFPELTTAGEKKSFTCTRATTWAGPGSTRRILAFAFASLSTSGYECQSPPAKNSIDRFIKYFLNLFLPETVQSV